MDVVYQEDNSKPVTRLGNIAGGQLVFLRSDQSDQCPGYYMVLDDDTDVSPASTGCARVDDGVVKYIPNETEVAVITTAKVSIPM